MRDVLKILIGAGATVLVAAIAHGPMGRGAAFMAQLQGHARAALATGGLGDIQVKFPDSPYARVAHLSGDVPLVRQTDALRLLRTVPGSAGAIWDGEPGGMADAGAPPPPAVNATNEVEPVPPASTQPPAQAAIARPGICQNNVDKVLAGRVMSFRSGSAWLNPQSRRIIADVAAALKPCRGYALVVGGHTDANGSETVNGAMSQERADRVRDALVAQGIPAGAVTARGYGSSRPLTAGHAADPANRRISFTVTGGE